METQVVNWKYSDAGRSTSKRPRQSNDCCVRALALVAGWEYDRMYNLLARWGRKCAKGMDLDIFMYLYPLDRMGISSRYHKSHSGKYGLNPINLPQVFPNGRFIVNMSSHVCVMIDGVLYDDESVEPDTRILGVWKIKQGPVTPSEF